MKVFGTVDSNPFTVTSNINIGKELVYGAWVGSESFYEGLLKYGSFDEYHFFVNSKKAEDILRRSLSVLNIKLDNLRVIHIKELATYLQKIKYTVFFTCGPDISRLAHIRSKYAKKYFPICGIAFQTISYTHVFRDVFFNNIMSDTHHFDSIICTSRAVLRVIEEYNKLLGIYFKKFSASKDCYNERLDLLPFGIDADSYGVLDKLNARAKLGLDKNKIIILYFGRFSLYDKADLYPLLVAFKEILKEKRNIILLLAGTDVQHKYGKKLKRIAAEMGLLPYTKFILHNCLKEKKLLFSAADIFISPSDNIQESFGITVLEAMASGLPVIVSDWNGYKDTVIHNQTGFRVPTYWSDFNIEDFMPAYLAPDSWKLEHLYLAQSVCVDIRKLTEYLLILVKNKTLRLRFGHDAINNVLERYDWKILIPAYEKLWQKLCVLSNSSKITRKINQLFIPEYFESFRHYPTRILNERDRISITKDGQLFLKLKKLPFGIEKELHGTILIKIIYIILTLLLKKSNASIGDVERHAKNIFKVQLFLIRYHIMWLLKKGLIKV